MAVEYHVHVPYRVLLGSIGTVNGSVLVRGVDGGGDLRSVNGNVEVLNSAGRFSAKTTNGDLRLELHEVLDGAPMNLETVNGSVILGLPCDAKANLKVLSMNGEFHSELPVTSTVGEQRRQRVSRKARRRRRRNFRAHHQWWRTSDFAAPRSLALGIAW